MATIVIRKLDETVKRKLQIRAAVNGRSMEAEAREVLGESLNKGRQPKQEKEIGAAIHRRFAAFGGVELEIPPRTVSKRSTDASRIPQLDRGLGTAIHELFAPLGGVELPIPPRRKSHRPIPTFS